MRKMTAARTASLRLPDKMRVMKCVPAKEEGVWRYCSVQKKGGQGGGETWDHCLYVSVSYEQPVLSFNYDHDLSLTLTNTVFF